MIFERRLLAVRGCSATADGRRDGRRVAARTGDVAEAPGITLPAVRFYEEQGLVVAPRGAWNRRVFDLNQRQELALVAKLRAADVPLREIADILEIRRRRCEAAARAAASHLLREGVLRLQSELETARATLRWTTDKNL